MLSRNFNKCDRCDKNTTILKGSFFNEDMLCADCVKKERKHPDFERARKIEMKEVSKGNYNFKGVGLPDDLK